MVSLDDVPGMRVVDLKAALKNLGLATTGLKAELAERLTEALQAEQNKDEPPAAETPADAASAEAAVEAETLKAAGKSEPADEHAAPEPAPAAKTADTVREDAETAAADVAAEDKAAAEAEPAGQSAADKAETSEPAGPSEAQQDHQPDTTKAAADAADADAAAEEPAAVPADEAGDVQIAQVQPSGVSTTATEAEAAGTAPQSEKDAAVPAEPAAAKRAAQAADAEAAAAPPAETEPAEPAAALAAPDEPATAKDEQESAKKQPAVEKQPAVAKEPAAEKQSAVEKQPAAEQEHVVEEQPAVEKERAAEAAPAAEKQSAIVEAAELEEEAPEMDFDVEPEEEEPAAKPAPMETDAAKSPAAKTAKRKHEPIPGVKAGPKVDAATGDAADARPNKLRRSDTGGSASLRTASHSGIPAATPEARGGVSVPLPNMKPTSALRIDGFMRPFTPMQVKALLRQQDCAFKDDDFWMPSIKTHCYIIYENAEQAETIRQATYNIQWPRDSSKRLQPKFVTVEEARDAISNQGGANPNAANPNAASTTPQAATAPATDSPMATDARQAILERRKQREAALRKQPEEPEEPALDDLFKKTTTWPNLYWMPADEKQVAKNKAEGVGTPVTGKL